MANINTEHLALTLTDDALKAWELVKDKYPNIVDINPEVIANLPGEAANVTGALYKDSIGLAGYICRNGTAIRQCAAEITRIDKRVGLALLAGGAALCLGGYVYLKLSRQESQIAALHNRIAALELNK